MTDRQLQTFLDVYAAGSFTKAATSSYVSAPALIQQINLLEQSIGFPLFERSHRGVRLTRGGEAFLPAAREILRMYRSAVELGKSTQEAAIAVRAAFPEEEYPALFFDAVRALGHDAPSLQITFVSADYNDHIALLRAGDADFTIIAEPDEAYSTGLVFEPLAADTLSFCMDPRDPLASEHEIVPGMLAGHRVLVGTYPYLRQGIGAVLERHGVSFSRLGGGYDRLSRMQSLLAGDILAIHSLWESSYTNNLAVVPSRLAAGRMGILYRPQAAERLQPLIEHLRQAAERLGANQRLSV